MSDLQFGTRGIQGQSDIAIRGEPLSAPVFRELLLGCGANHAKQMYFLGQSEWRCVTTLDKNSSVNPDCVWDLEQFPWPYDDNTFDECHAYEVVEHCSGQQGDADAFFRFFAELHRILKPAGMFIASVPLWSSQWAWGDPSHKRVITPGTLAFLSQAEYAKQCGVTRMTDFRSVWHGDFETVTAQISGDSMMFVLRCIK